MAATIKRNANLAFRKFIVWLGGITDVPDSPTISAGEGAPVSDTEPAGSLYLRTDGGPTTVMYVTDDGSSWTACAITGVDFGSGGLQTDVIAESTGAAGVTIDGLRIKDGAVAPAAGGSKVLDLTAVATGEAVVSLKDNLASAFEWKEASNSYVKAVTTNDQERIQLGKILADAAPVSIDMNDVTHTLVYGTAGSNQTKVTSRILFVDPNSGGASEKLLLPPEATSSGVAIDIFNTGGESIVVRDDGDGTTILTIPTAKAGRVACNGTTWLGLLGA